MNRSNAMSLELWSVKMYIFMSSGSRPRYRQDIVLAMAMPKGSQLQFRYALKYVENSIVDLIETKGSKTLTGSSVLIAYIDQSDNNKKIDLIPCRFAKINKVTLHGTTVSIIFDLDDYAYSENIDTFNVEIDNLIGSKIPSWQLGKKYPEGYYWVSIDVFPNSVIHSSDIKSWENLVSQFSNRSDFKEKTLFYKIEGLYPIGSSASISIENGYYNLKSKTKYEIKIYHFSPDFLENKWIRFVSANTYFTLCYNSLLSIDSRYDFKSIRFETSNLVKEECTGLSIYVIENDPKNEYGNFHFDLPIKIKSNWWKIFLYGIILGFLLAAPQIINSLLRDLNMPFWKAMTIIICSLVFGIGAGLFAAFSIKRDI